MTVTHAMTARELGNKATANRLSVSTVAQSLVSHVIDRFTEEMHRTIRKNDLGSTLVLGLEADR